MRTESNGRRGTGTPTTSCLRLLVVAGLAFGIVMTGLGWLARWFPPFDVFNNAVPAIALGAIGLVVLALVARDWLLILATALLAAINVLLFLAGIEGSPAEAAPGADRFLRVVTFNVPHDNDRIDGAIAFLGETDADVIVLQEMATSHTEELRRVLGARYPQASAISALSFSPSSQSRPRGRSTGRATPTGCRHSRAGSSSTSRARRSRWSACTSHGPFHTELQAHDVAAVTQFLRGRNLPVIVAGDFNLTPWTEQLKGVIRATGLQRYNTFHPTWPMRWRRRNKSVKRTSKSSERPPV